MDKFERLNRETRDFNNRNVDRFNESCKPTYTSQWWVNYNNNQVFKQNNGQYSNKYN